MLETVGLIALGYGGYAGWPWWYAPIAGAAMGLFNLVIKISNSPWMESPRRLKFLMISSPISLVGGAVIGMAFYFLGRMLSKFSF